MMKTNELNAFILQALREDAVGRDITTNALISKTQISKGRIIMKEDSVICGLAIAKKVFQKLSPDVRFQTSFKDGAKVRRNTTIATVKGRTRTLLTGERTALNFLAYLSGIATTTNQFVQKTRRDKVKILDTRKTTPGLRMLEKYAVRCGGGYNHRADLSELVLVKDNHREACYPKISIPQAVERIRRKTRKKLEIEVDNLIQFKQALTVHPEMILLDNMSCQHMKRAVQWNRKILHKQRPLLEASGGITLRNVAAVAKTGVDRISIGALTHSHKAINISMELTR